MFEVDGGDDGIGIFEDGDEEYYDDHSPFRSVSITLQGVVDAGT